MARNIYIEGHHGSKWGTKFTLLWFSATTLPRHLIIQLCVALSRNTRHFPSNTYNCSAKATFSAVHVI